MSTKYVVVKEKTSKEKFINAIIRIMPWVFLAMMTILAIDAADQNIRLHDKVSILEYQMEQRQKINESIRFKAADIQLEVERRDAEIAEMRKTIKALKKHLESPSQQNQADLKQYITDRYSKVPVETATTIAEVTNRLCEKHGVDFELVVGIMEQESFFDPSLKSSADARGLMQIRFETWHKELDIKHETDLHDIEHNIDLGIRILKHYLGKKKGNLTRALAAYNGSTGTKYANNVYENVGRFSSYRNTY